MAHEQLFLDTLDDLNSKINSSNDYEVLKASGLIRQLFLGSGTLIDKIDNKFNTEIIFEVAECLSKYPADFPKINSIIKISDLDPFLILDNSNFQIISKTREEFFKIVAGIADGKEYSIEDAIVYAANVMSGIHTGDASEGKRARLKKLEKVCQETNFLFPNISFQIEQIRTIGKIILRAIEPLQYKILNLERFENQKSLSYYFIVNISKQQNDEDNFIFDFGTEQNKNRVSIFLNNNDQICLRFIDNEEKVYKIFDLSRNF